MLPNYYELNRDNSEVKELKLYRYLEVANLILKLLSVGLISLTVIFSDWYWFLVVGVFIVSMIISHFANNITKFYTYVIKDDIIEISKTGFGGNSKVLFKDKIENCHFTKKFAQNTIVTTKEMYAAIITNNKDRIMFKPDQYMIGLLEDKMKEE